MQPIMYVLPASAAFPVFGTHYCNARGGRGIGALCTLAAACATGSRGGPCPAQQCAEDFVIITIHQVVCWGFTAVAAIELLNSHALAWACLLGSCD